MFWSNGTFSTLQELFSLNFSPAYTHLQLHNSVQDWGGREDSSADGIFELMFYLGHTQPIWHPSQKLAP